METSKMTCRGCIWRRRWLFSTANIAAFEQTEDIIAAAVDKEDHLLGGTRIHNSTFAVNKQLLHKVLTREGKKRRRSRDKYRGCGKSA